MYEGYQIRSEGRKPDICWVPLLCGHAQQGEDKLPPLKVLFIITDHPSTLPGELLPEGELKPSQLTSKLPRHGRSTMGLGNAVLLFITLHQRSLHLISGMNSRSTRLQLLSFGMPILPDCSLSELSGDLLARVHPGYGRQRLRSDLPVSCHCLGFAPGFCLGFQISESAYSSAFEKTGIIIIFPAECLSH